MTTKPVPETYYAGAYWGPRKESPEDCARRTATFLDLLASCDPALAHWYKPTRSRRDTRKYPLMPPDVAALTELFRGGVNREAGGPPIEELGFTFWFGNGGGNHDSADLRIACGVYAEGASNYCVLTPPVAGPDADRVLSASVLSQVVRSMALAWEPDWAISMSHAHRDLMGEEGEAEVLLGWVTYLPVRRGRVPPLPAPVRIEPVNEVGSLIVLTPERFTAANPEHVERARQVRGLLEQAGLLKPLQPLPG